MISCSKNDDPLQNTPIPGKGSFTDYGYIPATLSAGPDVAEFQFKMYARTTAEFGVCLEFLINSFFTMRNILTHHHWNNNRITFFILILLMLVGVRAQALQNDMVT